LINRERWRAEDLGGAGALGDLTNAIEVDGARAVAGRGFAGLPVEGISGSGSLQ
jgi:hypothetical protein